MISAFAARGICYLFDRMPTAPCAAAIMERLTRELGGQKSLTQQDRNYLGWALERFKQPDIPLENESPIVAELCVRLKDIGISYETLHGVLSAKKEKGRQ